MMFLGCGLFIFAIFLMTIFTNKLYHRFVLIVRVIFLSSFAITFIFPYVLGTYVDGFINENNYIYCSEASTHRGKFIEYVYTNNTKNCEKETEIKQKEYESL